MPARPRGIDLANPFDFAVVVVALGGEVLPHEEVGGLIIDGGAEVGEGLEGDYFKGRSVGGGRF